MPRYIEQMVSEQVRKSEMARDRRPEAAGRCARPVIAISRSMGSGARIIAQKLAERFGFSLWDKELIDAMAQEADVSRRVVEAFDEHAISEIEALARSMLGDHEIGGFMYARHLTRAVASIAKLGNAIILGRGASLLLPQALDVRIDASFDLRVHNMMQYENLTQHEAEEKLRQSDRDRHEFLMRVFGKERVERARYDLSIWIDEFTTDSAVEIIDTALREWCKKGMLEIQKS